MCGIVCQYYFDKEQKAQGWITSSLLAAISHRGKDQVCIHNYSHFNVGFRRLAITDIHSNQPGRTTWDIYLNGEIYNYKELGYEGTECEVLAKGFEEHGPDFVKKLNGMFVILAIHFEEVYVFRDRYGIKPVYYWHNKKSNYIIIASEIKAIISHDDYEFHVNSLAARQWLCYNNVITHDTLFEDIYKLDKGCILHVNTMEIENYWYWKFDPKPIPFEMAVGEVRRLVIQAIERQTPDMEVGICLSSGIDSNIINAVSKEIIGSDPYTFTAGFNHELDESHIARRYGNKHYEVIFNKVQHFEKTIEHLEDLRAGASWSNFGLYELASKFVKVLFDGAGADELFGGYKWRYESKDYYNDIINRTKVFDPEMEVLFYVKFGSDSPEARYEFDANHFLEAILLVGDKLSMAHTIEMRVPFLDNDLVDFCLTLPNEYKENKKILKAAFPDLLSEEILNQPKRGFSSPDWFSGTGNQAKKWSKAAFHQWQVIFNK